MQARRARKAVAVDDLITVAEWLHHNRYTTPDHLCLSGGSAGGLLVLAAAMRRPELWNAVIALAPLADMIRFERFGLGRHWTEEFGSVTDPDDFAALLAYSPYHNVRPGTDYLATLLIGFHEDTRTGAQHPRKMCAALQGATTGDRPVLLRYSYQSGHGPKPLSQAVGLAADAHAFAACWTGLGVNETMKGGRTMPETTETLLDEVEDLAAPVSGNATASKDGNDGADGSSDFV